MEAKQACGVAIVVYESWPRNECAGGAQIGEEQPFVIGREKRKRARFACATVMLLYEPIISKWEWESKARTSV